MQAVILAAGMGKRLKSLTNDNTKCMVKVNGITMIERMLFQLDKLHLERIILVVGYKGQELMDFILTLNVQTPIIYVTNKIYSKSNNIYSLYLARKYLMQDDTLLLESDLIFEDSILTKILQDPYPSLALVAKYESWMDGTVVTLDQDNNIKNFLGKKDFHYEDIPKYYKTVNIYKFSKSFSTTHYVPFLEAYSKALGKNEYYEQVLKVITLLDKPEIKATILNNESWYEIDDIQDLDIAESIFVESAEEKFKKMNQRYGGYWRYPKIIDYCYLVNPFFPTPRLLDELKANIERLIREYPSGIDVNNLLIGKYYAISKANIVVGNGAAELIKSLMEYIKGNIGMIIPTFEEYPNRRNGREIIYFNPSNSDYKYDTEDLINYFEDKQISSLLIINPDNPSGNYINKQDVIRLVRWAKQKQILIIVDESFIDFADETNGTLLDSKIIDKYHNLVVIKSISKSFGVPGLRLGFLASSNHDLIRHVQEDMSIWNINSFAEFYLQIFEKYKNDYIHAIVQFKEVRQHFIEDLKKINNLRVIPTQANYVMCEVLAPYQSKKLAEILLDEHDILIKNLSEKQGFNHREYIRIAIRQSGENKQLIAALKKVFNSNEQNNQSI